jgi:hypothetical protein
MVEVFKIKANPRLCSWVLPDDVSFTKQGNLFFEGLPKEVWQPPKFYLQAPNKNQTDFFIIAAGAFAFNQSVMDHPMMAMFFEMAGEILPIELETGEPLYILNTTEVVNALDRDKTLFRKNPHTGVVVTVEKHFFKPDRFTQSPIFKIPETCRAEVLTFAGQFVNPYDEFIENYHASGFAGLEFTKLWSSEQ